MGVFRYFVVLAVVFSLEPPSQLLAAGAESGIAPPPARSLSQELLESLPEARVWQENDILFGKPVQYEAVALTELLEAVFPDIHKYVALDYFLVLRAKGGYEPIVSLREAMSGRAFVTKAIAGLSAEAPLPCWEEAGQTNCNPHYFLIWSDGYYPDRPQPWGLTALELLPSDYLSQALAPRSDSLSISNGHGIYLQYCIECHSIKGVGGGVATDHVARDRPIATDTLRFFLFEFAKRDSEARMPDFSGLLDQQDVTDLQRYLEHMFVVHDE